MEEHVRNKLARAVNNQHGAYHMTLNKPPRVISELAALLPSDGESPI